MEDENNCKKPSFQSISTTSSTTRPTTTEGQHQSFEYRQTDNFQQQSSLNTFNNYAAAEAVTTPPLLVSNQLLLGLKPPSVPGARMNPTYTTTTTTTTTVNRASAQSSSSNTTTEEAAPSSSSSPPPPQRSAVVMERENFLIFIKILFKILDQANEPETRSRAQRIVLECKRRSKEGDPNFTPLMEAMERRLRAFVGEAKWRRAHLFLHHYIVNNVRGSNRTMTGVGASIQQRPTALVAGGK